VEADLAFTFLESAKLTPTPKTPAGPWELDWNRHHRQTLMGRPASGAVLIYSLRKTMAFDSDSPWTPLWLIAGSGAVVAVLIRIIVIINRPRSRRR